MGYSNRDNFWFGTEERMGWFRGPMKGGETTAEAWTSSGVLLGGGGYSFGSRASHKNYRYEWGSASPIKYAREMKSYFEGVYGRGLIYFYDPMIYRQNILPAQWAYPGLALEYEGPRLVYGVNPSAATTPNRDQNDLPFSGATYSLTNVLPGFRGNGDAVFLPIPEGYTLGLGAMYSATGTGGVFYNTVALDGTLGPSVQAFPVATNADEIINTRIGSNSYKGIWLWVGKTATGASSVTLYAMIARLMETSRFTSAGVGYGLGPYGQTPYGGQTTTNINPDGWLNGPWMGGLGHSGCKFEGPPTWSATGPLGGGQVGFAAGFREVGSWNYG